MDIDEILEGSVALSGGKNVIVRGGKEYPITEEELRKMKPYHKDIACSECKFIMDGRDLLLYHVQRDVRDAASEEPMFVGKFFMEGWTGHSSFYLFKCGGCDAITIDSPHGYSGNYMFLRCGEYRWRIVLDKRRYTEIYLRDNLQVPFFATFISKQIVRWKLRLAIIRNRKNPRIIKKDPASR